MSDRIEILEERIKDLEARVRVLEGKEEEPMVTPVQPVVQAAPQRVAPAPPPMTPIYDYAPTPKVPQTPPPAGPAPQFYAPPEQAVASKSRKEGMETFVGKNLMGILASVLVFIGLILFAILLIPHLTDAIKMVAMYGFSFALAGVSLYLLRKKENALLLSLSGCGVGAIFISLFVTYTYFHVIDMVPLYVLIVVWTIGTCYLSGKFSWLFQVIGEVGVFIACVLGMSVIDRNDMDEMLPGLMAFFIIGSGIFLFTKKKDLKDRLITDVFEVVNVTTMSMLLSGYFSVTYRSWYEQMDGDRMLLLVVLMFLAFVIGLVTYQIHRFATEPKEMELLFGLLYFGNLIFVLKCLYEESLWMYGVWLALGLFLYGVLSVITKDRFICKEIWRGICVAIMLFVLANIALYEEKPLMSVLLFAAACILFLGYGYLRKDRFSRVSGFIFYAMGMAGSLSEINGGKNWETVLTSAVYLVLLYAIGLGVYLWMKRHLEDYHMASKITVHLVLILAITMCAKYILPIDSDIRLLLIWILVSAMNIAVAKTTFANNWKTGAKEPVFWWVTYVLNAICIMVGFSQIADGYMETWIRMIAIVGTVGLCSVFTLTQLRSHSALAKNPLVPELFVSAKYCLVLVFVLSEMGVMDYVSDIAVLIFAIGCIALGFYIRKKGMRLFGLGLSIIAMVKLILIDIYYDNSAGRAASFLVCGMLCFAISALYTYIDKRMKKEEITEKSNTL